MTNFKKLIYQSHYRSTKEGDMLLSSFAQQALSTCTKQEVQLYEQLLEFSDAHIQNWVMNQISSPRFLAQIIKKIADFHRL